MLEMEKRVGRVGMSDPSAEKRNRAFAFAFAFAGGFWRALSIRGLSVFLR